MEAPLQEQRTLLDLQAADSAIDRLKHRRETLPELARLTELGTALEAVDQLTAEREGELATVRREQTRLEADVDTVRTKSRTEDERAASGRVTSPKELTAIQEELAALRRRQATLEDELLERMERVETLESELGELVRRREALVAEQADTEQARDAALAQLDRELGEQQAERTRLTPQIDPELLDLYGRIRTKAGGVGAVALLGNTCQGCRVATSAVELAAIRALPPEQLKRCEQCGRILVVG